jgi:hypothetical protein
LSNFDQRSKPFGIANTTEFYQEAQLDKLILIRYQQAAAAGFRATP